MLLRSTVGTCIGKVSCGGVQTGPTKKVDAGDMLLLVFVPRHSQRFDAVAGLGRLKTAKRHSGFVGHQLKRPQATLRPNRPPASAIEHEAALQA